MNAKKRGGKQMSMEVYKRALELCRLNDEYLTLGGGEPTLHDEFWAFFGLALSATDNLFIATNGSQTDTAIRLAQVAQRGVCSVALSQDIWHDPIDPSVVRAFTHNKRNGTYDSTDCREIRNVERNVMKQGRAIKNNLWSTTGCACETIMVTVNGDIKACGCLRAPVIGNVFDGYEEPNFNEDLEHCYKNIRKGKKHD